MAQEWDDESQSQEMQEVIKFLEENNIAFKVEGNKIMIKGDIHYANLFSLPTIIIEQGDNNISFIRVRDYNTIVVSTSTVPKVIKVSKEVQAYYEQPYLIIQFAS